MACEQERPASSGAIEERAGRGCVCGEHVGVVLGVDRERCDADSAWHTERFVCVLCVCDVVWGCVCRAARSFSFTSEYSFREFR